MKIDPLTAIDFYKADHRSQYPKGTTMVYSNFTPRSNKLSNLPDNKNHVVWFGLQFFIKDFLQEAFTDEFFNKPKDDVLIAYKRRLDNALGKGAVSIEHIEALYDLGYLPLEIRALKEGALVNMNIPCLTIHNTHPDFFWLVNYLESVMSAYLWMPCTSATTARWYRQVIQEYALKTGAVSDLIQFQGHDFSYRGMTPYAAPVSAAGHLLSFSGTDTVGAIDFLETYYHADSDKELVGASVPATEHSVMCMGTKEAEIETFRRLIDDIYPSGIVSIVADTWDFFQVITDYTVTLKDNIMNRDGKVVFRPDSGDPVDIICGTADVIDYGDKVTSLKQLKEWGETYLHEELCEETEHGEIGYDKLSGFFRFEGKIYKITYYPFWNRYDKQYYYIDGKDKDTTIEEVELTPEEKGAVQCLYEVFGGTKTAEGYIELDAHVGLIYGDSITPDRCKRILEGLAKKGFASSNIVFGIGSYTYQYVTRDTWGFAVKATYGEVNGEARNIHKDPKTDSGTKKSHCGLLRVVRNEETNQLEVEQEVSKELAETGELELVYKDGELIREQSLADIRAYLEEQSVTD